MSSGALDIYAGTYNSWHKELLIAFGALHVEHPPRVDCFERKERANHVGKREAHSEYTLTHQGPPRGRAPEAPAKIDAS